MQFCFFKNDFGENEKTQTMTWNSSILGRMKSESVQSFNSPNESTIKTKTWNKAGRYSE